MFGRRHGHVVTSDPHNTSVTRMRQAGLLSGRSPPLKTKRQRGCGSRRRSRSRSWFTVLAGVSQLILCADPPTEHRPPRVAPSDGGSAPTRTAERRRPPTWVVVPQRRRAALFQRCGTGTGRGGRQTGLPSGSVQRSGSDCGHPGGIMGVLGDSRSVNGRAAVTAPREEGRSACGPQAEFAPLASHPDLNEWARLDPVGKRGRRRAVSDRVWLTQPALPCTECLAYYVPNQHWDGRENIAQGGRRGERSATRATLGPPARATTHWGSGALPLSKRCVILPCCTEARRVGATVVRALGAQLATPS